MCFRCGQRPRGHVVTWMSRVRALASTNSQLAIWGRELDLPHICYPTHGQTIHCAPTCPPWVTCATNIQGLPRHGQDRAPFSPCLLWLALVSNLHAQHGLAISLLALPCAVAVPGAPGHLALTRFTCSLRNSSTCGWSGRSRGATTAATGPRRRSM